MGRPHGKFKWEKFMIDLWIFRKALFSDSFVGWPMATDAEWVHN